MKVLILHTAPSDVQQPGRIAGEFELDHTARNIASVLPGAIVCGVRGYPREIVDVIDAHAPDVVFNLCEAPQGRPYLEPHAAALFEWLGVRFTGAGSATLALCRRKDLVKPILRAAGIGVPANVDPIRPAFPCIVKPADEDGSAGVFADSVCDTPQMLEHARGRLQGPVMVEEFLPGREFVVSLWGAAEPENVSVGETVFQAGIRLITYDGKWNTEGHEFANTPMHYDTEIPDVIRQAIIVAARSAWRAVEARHYLRVDVRLDSNNSPRVLDVNPNPEMGPEVGICRAVQEAGWTWERFVKSLIEWA
jgi:D-alanine-D-alanine ligase